MPGQVSWDDVRALAIRGRTFDDSHVPFLTLALAGEVGELANLTKKRWRGKAVSPTADDDEMGDILVYLILRAEARGVDLLEVAYRKMVETGQRTDQTQFVTPQVAAVI